MKRNTKRKRSLGKKSSISKAGTYAAMGEFWDEHDLSDYWDKTRLARADVDLETVQITAYDRESFKRAISDYGKIEAQAAQGEKIEPVLVSAGPIETMRRAYPNFFLDIKDFAARVAEIIAAASKRG